MNVYIIVPRASTNKGSYVSACAQFQKFVQKCKNLQGAS